VWSLEDASIRTERQGTPWRRICLHGALHRSAELSPAAPVLLLPTSPEACVEDAPGAWAHPTATAAAAATTAIISRRELHGHLVERGQGQLTGQDGGRACAGHAQRWKGPAVVGGGSSTESICGRLWHYLYPMLAGWQPSFRAPLCSFMRLQAPLNRQRTGKPAHLAAPAMR